MFRPFTAVASETGAVLLSAKRRERGVGWKERQRTEAEKRHAAIRLTVYTARMKDIALGTSP